jgi:ribosomal protein L21
MFAVLKTGGKQYKVQSGDVLRVELLGAEAGEKIQFNEILMVGSKIGVPMIEGAAVQAEVIDTIKAEILPAPEFYYAEDYHQQYLSKNPQGYCGLGGTGVSCV